jgi:phosphatidate cytidylyltransferase
VKARLITAVVGILAVLALVYFGSWAMAIAICAVSLIALDEYRKMLAKKGISIFLPLTAPMLCIVILAAALGSLPLFLSTFMLFFVLMLFIVLKIKQSQMNSLIYSDFGLAYMGLGFGSLMYLREASDLIPASSVSIYEGIFLILFCLIGTWASDSFAYLVGRKWGKHKMAPHISPNKTVEGLIGGIVGCIVLCLIFAGACSFDLGNALLMSIVVAIAAPIGDLFESYIKRACDVKDSGSILPGHGGMMDRFDSLLFVAPAVTSLLCMLK